MTPRSFIKFFRSPMGALLIFVLLLGGAIALIVGLKSSNQPSPLAPVKALSNEPQTIKTVDRDMSEFKPPKEATPVPKPQPVAQTKKKTTTKKKVSIPPISLFAEAPKPAELKPLESKYAPYGRLIRCELVITVDSSSISTPIVGLITHDVWHGNELIIPAGTEVHGNAQADRTRERIASSGQWTLVWQDGKELRINGLALDREKNPNGNGWAITDGSAGLRGKLLKTDNLAEIKLFAATLLSGAAASLTENEQTIFGSQSTPSLNNTPFEGAQAVLSTYATQVFNAIERDGFYVRVPAGKQFYLYVTETIDTSKAVRGLSLNQRATSIQSSNNPQP